MKKQCQCGVPSNANWYLWVILGNESDTWEAARYACHEHKEKREAELMGLSGRISPNVHVTHLRH